MKKFFLIILLFNFNCNAQILENILLHGYLIAAGGFVEFSGSAAKSVTLNDKTVPVKTNGTWGPTRTNFDRAGDFNQVIQIPSTTLGTTSILPFTINALMPNQNHFQAIKFRANLNLTRLTNLFFSGLANPELAFIEIPCDGKLGTLTITKVGAIHPTFEFVIAPNKLFNSWLIKIPVPAGRYEINICIAQSPDNPPGNHLFNLTIGTTLASICSLPGDILTEVLRGKYGE